MWTDGQKKNIMNKFISLITVLAVLSGCIKEKPTGADLKVGDSLPDFRVEMNDGRTVTDESLSQTVSVVMFSKLGFNSMSTKKFQMFRLDLEKAEEPEIKLPTSAGSLKKQEFQKNIYFRFID